jgi:predicted transcriptional regulator of viral defense system
VYQFTHEAYRAGIEEQAIDGAMIKVYSPEKTLADCFKFRNKIGMDVVLEALKLYRSRMKFDHKKLLEYARICRVEKIMRPYLEASL